MVYCSLCPFPSEIKSEPMIGLTKTASYDCETWMSERELRFENAMDVMIDFECKNLTLCDMLFKVIFFQGDDLPMCTF